MLLKSFPSQRKDTERCQAETYSAHIFSRIQGIIFASCCPWRPSNWWIQDLAGICLYRSDDAWLFKRERPREQAAGNEGETSAAMAALEDEELDAGAWGEAELDLENGGDAEAADGEPAAGGEGEEEEDGGWEMDVRIALEP